MKVLWVFAHPEPRSLNASLRDVGIAALVREGHEVWQSDLYAMGWKAVVDAADYDRHGSGERLVVPAASARAHRSGGLSGDIEEEQRKLLWADAVVVQFPLWWYGMPAILKGWFDRVFVKGFAYGVRSPRCAGRTVRYGDGVLAGKRALTVVTSGSPDLALGPRGINGQLDHVLFPLLHGTLWYTGMGVLPPVVVTGADRLDARAFEHAAARIRVRVTNMAEDDVLPFRTQDGGDYDDDLVLRPEIAPGRTGLDVHYA